MRQLAIVVVLAMAAIAVSAGQRLDIPSVGTQDRAGPEGSAGDAVRPRAATTFVKGVAAPIASNFDRDRYVMPAWESGTTGAIPASSAPDVLGAFRFNCSAGHVAYDDPIVFGGQPGRSHLHQFFGNTGTDSHSTYASLRTSGDSTCMNPLNRSAYWIPAMLNGRGQVVRPDFVTIYYKRRPAGDSFCRKQGRACVILPRGLRFVFGYDMVSHGAATGGGYYNCQGKDAEPGHYPTISEAARHCPVGDQIGALINAPDCWDGVNLDSPNHRDHVAYPGYGNWGYLRCPATHPYVIPTFTLGAWYTTDATLDRSGAATWHLSSDEMPGMAPMKPGSTLHADWWGAWDDATLEVWTRHCIDRMLSCHGGDLGNGTQLRQEGGPPGKAMPRLIPMPPRPVI